MSRRPDQSQLSNPFASPSLDKQTYQYLEQKLKLKIAELNADHSHYIPVAVVLIVNRQTCINCGDCHMAQSSQLHVRAVNRRGDSWTRALPLGLVPPHLPRESVIREQSIPACSSCFVEAPAQQLALWDDAELEASFPIFDRNGDSIITTPLSVTAARKLARKSAPYVDAARRAAIAPKRKSGAQKPKASTLTLDDL